MVTTGKTTLVTSKKELANNRCELCRCFLHTRAIRNALTDTATLSIILRTNTVVENSVRSRSNTKLVIVSITRRKLKCNRAPNGMTLTS